MIRVGHKKIKDYNVLKDALNKDKASYPRN